MFDLLRFYFFYCLIPSLFFVNLVIQLDECLWFVLYLAVILVFFCQLYTRTEVRVELFYMFPRKQKNMVYRCHI